jgi:hypothetical protein
MHRFGLRRILRTSLVLATISLTRLSHEINIR